jgi:hypothetical protein
VSSTGNTQSNALRRLGSSKQFQQQVAVPSAPVEVKKPSKIFDVDFKCNVDDFKSLGFVGLILFLLFFLLLFYCFYLFVDLKSLFYTSC